MQSMTRMKIVKLAEYLRLRKHRVNPRGCAFWLAEVNRVNCSFPRCQCYNRAKVSKRVVKAYEEKWR